MVTQQVSIKMDDKSLGRHRRAVEAIVGCPVTSPDIFNLSINYKLHLGSFTKEFIGRIMGIVRLLKDPDVSISINDLNEENVALLLESGRALTALVEAYQDKQIRSRRYGKDRDDDF